MKAEDRNRFKAALSMLCATFAREVTEALLDGFWYSLADLDIAMVEVGCRRALRDCKRMPMPAEIRELSGEEPVAAQAIRAWQTLRMGMRIHGAYASVNFDDKAINATVRNMGGWEQLCRTDIDEWVRKDFERIYAIYARRSLGAEESAPLVGIHERTNGFLTGALVDVKTIGGRDSTTKLLGEELQP